MICACCAVVVWLFSRVLSAHSCARAVLPVLRENRREMQEFAVQIVVRLTELQVSRAGGFVPKLSGIVGNRLAAAGRAGELA